MGPDDPHLLKASRHTAMLEDQSTLFLRSVGGTPLIRSPESLRSREKRIGSSVTGLNLPMLVVPHMASRMGSDTAVAVAKEILPEARLV